MRKSAHTNSKPIKDDRQTKLKVSRYVRRDTIKQEYNYPLEILKQKNYIKYGY